MTDKRVRVQLTPYAYHELQQKLMAVDGYKPGLAVSTIDLDNVTITKPEPPRNGWVPPVERLDYWKK